MELMEHISNENCKSYLADEDITHFLCARSSADVKLHVRKIGGLGKNWSTHVHAGLTKMCWYMCSSNFLKIDKKMKCLTCITIVLDLFLTQCHFLRNFFLVINTFYFWGNSFRKNFIIFAHCFSNINSWNREFPCNCFIKNYAIFWQLYFVDVNFR